MIKTYALFWFLKQGLGLVSPTHFVHDFSRKVFLMLSSMNWPNRIVWLLLLRDILGNMCFAIVCFLGCDVINFEINLIFLIKPSLYMTKNLNILRTKRASKVEQKAFFIIFEGLLVAKVCLIPKSASLWSFAKRLVSIWGNFLEDILKANFFLSIALVAFCVTFF